VASHGLVACLKMKVLKFVLESTSFIFDKRIYKQKFGTPIDSPLLPIIVDLIMRDLEREALKRFGHKVSFYYRYVDDIAKAVSNHLIGSTN